MERPCSAGALKSTSKDNRQLSYLPQLQRVQKPAHQRTQQSPSSSPKTPRLPPINARRDWISSKEAQNGSFSTTRRTDHVADSQKYACSWPSENCARETQSLEKLKPVEKRWPCESESVKPKSQMVSSTNCIPPGSPTIASYKETEAEATNSTSYFSKPRFRRRTAAQRHNLYRTGNTNEVLDSEILAMEEKSPHIFAVRDVSCTAATGFKDLGGKRIESSYVYKEDITCMLPSLEGKRGLSDEEDRNPKRQEKRVHKTRAMKKFLDALDQHYYNNYVAANPDRRMAICEEIEATIVHGNINLTQYREQLRLQELLDNWIL